jgi:hypothetical protein
MQKTTIDGKKFYNTERQTLNICPGFELNYTFNISKAEELDKSGKLKSHPRGKDQRRFESCGT